MHTWQRWKRGYLICSARLCSPAMVSKHLMLSFLEHEHTFVDSVERQIHHFYGADFDRRDVCDKKES